MTRHIWPEAEIATLDELWARNLTAGQIALKMDLTRNAVIGKAYRLHLPRRHLVLQPCPTCGKPWRAA